MDSSDPPTRRCPPGHLADTAQGALFPDLPQDPGPPARAAHAAPDADHFQRGRPDEIHLGSLSLHQYLQHNQLRWVLRLRELLWSLDLSALLSVYKSDGRKPIHPAVMLGLIFYGILQRQSSLRELELLARRDLGAWWLCGGLFPDHSTIGKFLRRHQEVLTDDFFETLVKTLVRKLKLSPSQAAADGTVIAAACSHYKLLKVEAAQQEADQARQQARTHPEDARAQSKAEQAEHVAEAAQAREQRRLIADPTRGVVRVSPHEPDAVVQPLKNGARRPSYKPSVMVNPQRFILGKHVHGSDESVSVEPMLQQYQRTAGTLPRRTLLDAGYHNLDVLGLFAALNLDLLCPPGPEREMGRASAMSQGKFRKSQFRYDEERDVYVCPAGQSLPLQGRELIRDSRGRTYHRYRGRKCADCKLRAQCTTAKRGRTVKRYPGDELKEAMVERFAAEDTRRAYSRRREMVEPVFAELKERQGLRRFRRRALSGVALEFSLHCMAYNIKRALRLDEAGVLGIALVREPGQPWRVLMVWRLVLRDQPA